MKKRLDFSVLVLFIILFLLPFVQSSSVDFWIECQNSCSSSNNACTGSGNSCCSYNQIKNGEFCCSQGGGTWLAVCTCTDIDGDGYIVQSTNIASCVNQCGSDGQQQCLGNNDCDDDDGDIYPGADENSDALCSDTIDNDCDGDTDCADSDCAGYGGPGGVTCCQPATVDANCGNDNCKEETCVSNTCSITNRLSCDATECQSGQYCDVAGGNCQTPDASSVVCLNCAPDQTTATWTWIPPNHQDNGKGYDTNLFDSNAGSCPASSCSSPPCTCYDSNGNNVNHKGSLGSRTCCGDDANEFYKPDYNGPECTGDVNDCVWSTGDAQASNTGNKEYWCYLHEWNECKVNADIGDKVGGVTCAGTSSSKAWIPNPGPENVYSCTDGLDNDGDTRIDCADSDCAGLAGPGGVTCCQTPANCPQDDCKIESCTSNNCVITNRLSCDATECQSGQYCDVAGGNCQTPDASSVVCLNCAPDQTTATWTWIPPNHQDNGKGYDTNLFDSNAGSCPASSCSSPPCTCYDSNGNNVNHKGSLGSRTCCGDDANEFYKPDYNGPECTGDVNDCVWSTGDAQASNTGNKEYWCYLHEWNECKVNADIGDKVGGVTCAGTSSSKAWIPNPGPENVYSCTDGLDNDGDTRIDCADSDCRATVSGFVREEDNSPIFPSNVDILKNGLLEYTDSTDSSGFYTIGSNCGTYDMVASAADYISSTVSQINFPPVSSVTQDFTLFLGTSCESDCTYMGDNTIHQECEGINGCKFCPDGCSFCDVNIAQQSCNLAQPGWERLYNDPSPECVNGCVIACQESCPEAKIETKASVTCDEGENLIKITKLVTYNGKLLKLNVVVCG